MSWFYRHIVRPVLFNHDSEEIHNSTMETLGRVGRSKLGLDLLESFWGMAHLPINLWGLHFPNPVGLAAGSSATRISAAAWFGYNWA